MADENHVEPRPPADDGSSTAVSSPSAWRRRCSARTSTTRCPSSSSRALPDVRDGLKPVHRRVLYAMYDGGYRPEKGFYKCARVVGDVMGTYHPHGDSSIYDALVRLAQPWSMRMPLVDSNGNFGSPGNDPAAAMRYTECKMTPLSMEMVRDIDEETVDFKDNYDGRTQEPTVLPVALPEPADQRLGGHRGRHGHQHPAAQPARGRRRRPVVPGAPGGLARGAARRRSSSGSRAPTSRPARWSWAARASRRRTAPVAARSRCARSSRSRRSRTASAWWSPSCRTRSTPTTSRRRSPTWSRTARSAASRTSATRRRRRTGQRLVIVLKRDAVAKVVLNNLYKHTDLQTLRREHAGARRRRAAHAVASTRSSGTG